LKTLTLDWTLGAERLGIRDLLALLGEEEFGIRVMAWEGECIAFAIDACHSIETDHRVLAFCPAWYQ
jgi:hypothetical protein